MLSRNAIRNLVHLRLSDVEIREALLALTVDDVDLDTLSAFVETIEETLDDGDRQLSAIDNAIDCSGTGGSGLTHFNTSTTVAFVLAAGGLKVTKFGNRAATSASGSFDLLHELGFPLGIANERLEDVLESAGVAFLYAPQYYPVLARFASARKTLAVKTIFNFLGPLLNPVKPAYRLLGVSDAAMQSIIASYLAKQASISRALVVRGESGLDEMEAGATTRVVSVRAGVVEETVFSSDGESDMAAEPVALSPADNKAIFENIVAGQDNESIHYRTVCLNAGAGFYVTGRAQSIEEGSVLAAELLFEGDVGERVSQARRVYAGSPA